MVVHPRNFTSRFTYVQRSRTDTQWYCVFYVVRLEKQFKLKTNAFSWQNAEVCQPVQGRHSLVVGVTIQ